MDASKSFAMRTERCDFMLAAVKGYIRGNTVVIEDEDMRACDGAEAVATLPDLPKLKRTGKNIDWDSFVVPSERGEHVDEYMKEMREFQSKETEPSSRLWFKACNHA